MVPGFTACPVCADWIAAKQSARLSRLPRAPLSGSRFSSTATSSSPIVPAKPSLNHAPWSFGRATPSAVVIVTDCSPRFGPVLARLPLVPPTKVVSSGPCLIAASNTSEAWPPSKATKACASNGGFASLAGGAVAGRVDASAARPDQAGQEIEPVHREIEEDQIVDLLERRADDPAMVPVNSRVRGDDVADQAGANRLANVGEVRRPAAVLVDGELDAMPVGEFDQPLACVEIDDKRLLRQHMLAGLQRRFHQRHALHWMRRDVEHLDIVAAQQALEIVGGNGIRVEFVATRRGAHQRARHDRRDVQTGTAVGVKMGERNAPCPDQRDLRPVVLGIGGL